MIEAMSNTGESDQDLLNRAEQLVKQNDSSPGNGDTNRGNLRLQIVNISHGAGVKEGTSLTTEQRSKLIALLSDLDSALGN